MVKVPLSIWSTKAEHGAGRGNGERADARRWRRSGDGIGFDIAGVGLLLRLAQDHRERDEKEHDSACDLERHQPDSEGTGKDLAEDKKEQQNVGLPGLPEAPSICAWPGSGRRSRR
jgi:hypothetical protein